MLRVRIGNLYLGITFQRDYVEVQSEKFKHSPTYKLRATYCNLHRLTAEGKTDAIIARSFVKAATSDNFDAEEGRKKALTRALKQHGLNRGERTLVWAAYHDRPRPKSVPKAVKVQPVEAALAAIMEGSPAGQQADGYREPAGRQALLAVRADADYHDVNRSFTGLDLNAGEGAH